MTRTVETIEKGEASVNGKEERARENPQDDQYSDISRRRKKIKPYIYLSGAVEETNIRLLVARRASPGGHTVGAEVKLELQLGGL